MLSSITPLGERGRGNRFWVAATSHVVGSAAGGLLLGVAAGGLGAGLRAATGARSGTTATLLISAAAIASLVSDLVVRPTRLPCWRRQVNEQWLDQFRPWVYAGGFGLQLGAAVLTIITSATTYAVVVAAVVQPSFLAAMSVGGAFGLLRGLSILAVVRVDRPERLIVLHRRMAAVGGGVGTAVGIGAGLVGALGIVLAASGGAS